MGDLHWTENVSENNNLHQVKSLNAIFTELKSTAFENSTQRNTLVNELIVAYARSEILKIRKSPRDRNEIYDNLEAELQRMQFYVDGSFENVAENFTGTIDFSNFTPVLTQDELNSIRINVLAIVLEYVRTINIKNDLSDSEFKKQMIS